MIELIFLDVDGCLTDGKIIYTSSADEIKEFNVKDGAAIEAWLKLGKKVAIITGRSSKCVELRAKDLKIDLLFQGIKDKLSCAKELLERLNLSFENTACIGDYYNDKSLLEAVKLSFKPADALANLKTKYTLENKGGQAAVAEMIEHIIRYNDMQEEWDKLWR
ncbi:3-deoxy-D-manno-octulosonate 8-phosphate phosphatase [Campylobacter sp. MIT 99-7217]|uniref:KdsC family phosphatase n=1 Tax=Campylobacter sp. MIT 99-7217 TaxID=535091 RepID=UPI00115C1925|nr:HAD-IIIA family hydrolase [Campylobacter sp. MIT 99-7217]TQR31903.1 3-deoxy-D-manno-octulosonate 8-phosphate phosphatase [Campylobacter sp. MIT 99-7217]